MACDDETTVLSKPRDSKHEQWALSCMCIPIFEARMSTSYDGGRSGASEAHVREEREVSDGAVSCQRSFRLLSGGR